VPKWSSVYHRARRRLARQRPPWDETRELSIPQPRPGDVTGPPTFVGVGVQKAGTSWWHDLIEAHPDCHHVPGAHKERHYFCRTGLKDERTDLLGADYARQFPRPPGYAVGEWTPRYLYLPWAAHQLRKAAPDARILVILRDPVERLRSGVAHQLNRGGAVDSLELTAAVKRGCYGRQMRRLFESFEAAQVLVLQFEQIRADPLPSLARTYRFLGLDPTFVPAGVQEVRGATVGHKPGLPAPLVEELSRYYRHDMADLAVFCPDLDLSLWPAVNG
jgi:hypothetical protein